MLRLRHPNSPAVCRCSMLYVNSWNLELCGYLRIYSHKLSPSMQNDKTNSIVCLRIVLNVPNKCKHFECARKKEAEFELFGNVVFKGRNILLAGTLQSDEFGKALRRHVQLLGTSCALLGSVSST